MNKTRLESIGIIVGCITGILGLITGALSLSWQIYEDVKDPVDDLEIKAIYIPTMPPNKPYIYLSINNKSDSKVFLEHVTCRSEYHHDDGMKQRIYGVCRSDLEFGRELEAGQPTQVTITSDAWKTIPDFLEWFRDSTIIHLEVKTSRRTFKLGKYDIIDKDYWSRLYETFNLGS